MMNQKLTCLEVSKNIIKSVSIASLGEAEGHNLWIDDVFLNQLKEFGIKNKEIRCNFTHCSNEDSVINYLGKIQNFNIVDNKCVGDLVVSDVAAKNPVKGDLAGYVLGLADEAPDALGLSIKFSHDLQSEAEFIRANSVDGVFKSPDTNNVNNFPHARLGELVSIDIVGEPACNNGLFNKKVKIVENLEKENKNQMNELERFKLLKDEFKNDLNFAVECFEKNLNLDQAKVAYKDVEINKLKSELAKKSEGVEKPVTFSAEQAKKDFKSLVNTIMVERKVNKQTAMSIVARENPEIHQKYIG